MTVHQTLADAFESYVHRRLLPKSLLHDNVVCAVDRSMWTKIRAPNFDYHTDIRETELVYQPEIQALLLSGWAGYVSWASLGRFVKPRPFGDWIPMLVLNRPSGKLQTKVIYIYPEDWKTKGMPISPEDL